MSDLNPCWCVRAVDPTRPDENGTPHLWEPGWCAAAPVPEPARVDPQTEALQAIAVGLADLGQAVAEIRDLVAIQNGVTTVGTLAGRRDPILPVERIEQAIRSARSDWQTIRGDGWQVFTRHSESGAATVHVEVDVDLLP